jgi:hypothetical protein
MVSNKAVEGASDSILYTCMQANTRDLEDLRPPAVQSCTAQRHAHDVHNGMDCTMNLVTQAPLSTPESVTQFSCTSVGA